MKVVLDSNILIADFWLESTNFKVLFESQKNGDIEILIPEIVLDEVSNKYSQRLLKSKEDIDSELNKFKRISREKIQSLITEELVDSSVLKYKKHLKKVVATNEIKVLPYPKTSHKFLVNKAMLNLKPFNATEKGYRDSLIWENIKKLLTEEEMVSALPELVFITNNYKDFATPEYELHNDLIKELENEDFNPEAVKVYPSLSEYNEKQGKLFFSQAQSFKKKLIDGNIYNFDLLSITNKYLFDNFVGTELYLYESDIDEDSSEPTVSGINENYDIEIIDVKKLNATEYLVDIEFNVESEIDFFIEKSEYWSMADNKRGISIQDPDWNRHVMWASSTELVHLSMSVILDVNMNVVSCQIDKVNRNYSQQYQ